MSVPKNRDKKVRDVDVGKGQRAAGGMDAAE
jgi:hypothetical protein